LVIDIERLRQSRAAASRVTSPDLVAHTAAVAEQFKPGGDGNSSRPAVVAPDTSAAANGATKRAPAIARMRIFFGKKLPNGKPARSRTAWLLIGSAVVLLLVVGGVALMTKPPLQSDWFATANKIRETSGSVAAAPEVEAATPVESPSPAVTEDGENGTERQTARGGGRDQRKVAQARKAKQPSAIKRAWDKLKKKFPF
ncbi:MAG TPA: hypothetical protein VJ715_07180, partial [Pyrinomonadaceae bacterium]|nr:hypothetical protein [Pyrinomonadaceae bacterium]